MPSERSLAVPGFEAKAIEVKISGNLLTVRAERKEKDDETGKLWGETSSRR